MAQSKYASNKETTNFARMSRIILGPCTDVLCDVLKKEIRPSDLPKLVRTYLAKLPTQQKSPITKEQENLIQKTIYSDFDITLLYFLLRNISNIPSHRNQWGKIPISGDTSLSANIEKIRLIRNGFGHSSAISISDTDFNKKWKEIFDIVRDLESYLGNATIHQDAVTYIKSCSMDHDLSNKYIEDMVTLNNRLKDLSGEVKEIKKEIIPWNVKEQYYQEVLTWKEDDVVFVESHNFQSMLDRVKNQPFVTFVGVPGSGKTATTRHIALILQKEGYEVLPITDKNKIKDYCDPYSPQVFVIDDVLGVFGFDIAEFHMLIKYQKSLSQPTMRKSKFLMTCRETIFRNETLLDTFLSKEEKIVKLHSDENALTFDDKYDLLEKYKLDTNLFTANSMSLTSNMFPFLCKFFSEMKFKHYGSKFFISPVPCLLMLLDEMKARNKIQYASLVLLMANENKLSEDLDFEGVAEETFNDIKYEVLKRCKVNSRTDNHAFIDALKEMEGTYTQQSGCQFSFIHDSMFEIIANHFGCQFPEIIIKYLSSDYIANYIKLESHDTEKRKLENGEEPRSSGQGSTYCQQKNVIDLCIILKEKYYTHFVTRLLKDLENGELYNVFRNECLKCKNVLHVFIGELTKKTYSELYACFFAEMTDQLKINRYENDQNGLNQGEYFQVLSLLFDERNILDHYGIWSSIRAISWVVFYGHNGILKYIIDQVLLQTGNADAIFQTSYLTGSKHNSYTGIDEDDTTIEKSNHSLADESRNEQWRLLCLGCYSNDLTTVQILLHHVGNNAIDNRKSNEDKIFKDIKPLVIVCSFGYLDIAQELLRAGADVNQKAIFETPLTAACEKGHLCIVKELINAGANVNFDDGYQTPLTTASKEGHLNIVRELIKAGADINLKAFFDIPLTAAYKNEHFQIFKELLNAGAEPNVNYGEKTLLSAVCEKGDLIILKQLIEAGAKVNMIDKEETPLISACKVGNLAIVTELIEAGANINLKDCFYTPLSAAFENEHFDVFEKLLHKGADVNIQYGGKTLLTDECRNGNFKNVRKLIKRGADVNLKDIYQTPLTIACRKGYLPIVKELLQAGADVNLSDSFCSPLIAAYASEHFSIVEELLDAGSDANQKYEENTLLIAECLNGNLFNVKTLIKAGADVNQMVSFLTPLIAAYANGHYSILRELLSAGAHVNLSYGENSILSAECKKGNLMIVKELIKAGADVNFHNRFNTPLINACKEGHSDIVKELIKAGADLNLKTCYDTPLKAAYQMRHIDVVVILIRNGADIDIKYKNKKLLTVVCQKDDLTILKEMIKTGADVNIQDGCTTPLIAACKMGNLEIVRTLITATADVNIWASSDTPLTAAFNNNHLNIVKELINNGLDTNIKYGNNTFQTFVSGEGYLGIVKALIKAGTDVNPQEEFKTPLTSACRKGYVSIVKELIKAGADVNQEDKYQTPLTIACQKGYLGIVSQLVTAGAGVNVRDKSVVTVTIEEDILSFKDEIQSWGEYSSIKNQYQTPLTAACRHGHFDIVYYLINAEADVNMKDEYQTPLTAACEYGYFNIVQNLLKAGAQVNLKDNYQTPLTIALLISRKDIVDELIQAGADVNLNDGFHTPLALACRKNPLRYCLETINRLDNQSDVTDKTYQKTAYVKGILRMHEELSSSRMYDNLADEKTQVGIVKGLIKAGAIVNLKTTFGSPLSNALEDNNFIIAEELIKAGADVSLGHNSHELLISASRKGSLITVKKMVESGADVNLRDKIKKQIVSLNSQECLSDVYKQRNLNQDSSKFPEEFTVKKISDDINMKNGCETPLTASCEEGHLCIVKELIIAGADVNVQDALYTPLTAACGKGHLNIVKELIIAGADVNLQGTFHTPLTSACQKGHLDIVVELVKAEADVNLRDTFKAPIDISCESGHLDIAEFLRKAGASIILKDKHPRLLTLACQRGYIVFVDELIRLGTDVNGSDKCITQPNYLSQEEYLYDYEYSIAKGGDIIWDDSYVESCNDFPDELFGNVVTLKNECKTGIPTYECRKPIIAACQTGNMGILKELIKAGADVNILDRYHTSLTISCREGHLCIVEELINAGANVNQRDEYATPLTTACQKGHLSIVRKLIKSGADVNQQDKYRTPLTVSCINGRLRIVLELIKSGADVNLKDLFDTPMTVACKNGYFVIAEILKKSGAQYDHPNLLPLACSKGYLFIVKRLINVGADVNLTSTFAVKISGVLDFDFVFTNSKTDNKINSYKCKKPLTVACQQGHLCIVQELIKSGAKINLTDGYHTPMTTACTEGQLGIVKELIGAGADVNRQGKYVTPLTTACQRGYLSIVEMLLKARADVNLKDIFLTPLKYAFTNNNIHIAEVLLKAGAEIILEDAFPNSLTLACLKGNIFTAKKLIKAGIEINFPSPCSAKNILEEETKEIKIHFEINCQLQFQECSIGEIYWKEIYSNPLLAACVGGHLRIVKELIISGAYINLQVGYRTPLTAACLVGHLSIVEELIKAGANVNMKDTFYTPLKAAFIKRHFCIAKVLIDAGANLRKLGEYEEFSVFCREVFKTGNYVNQSKNYATFLKFLNEKKYLKKK